MAINGGVGNVNILKSPRSSLANYGYPDSDHQVLVSCNSPMIYQLQWGQTLSRITNLMPESDYLKNDVVNIIFDVWIGNNFESSFDEATGNMFFAGSLRKSRDLPYIGGEGIDPEYTLGNALVNYHTFTIDISPIVKNYLSYTLTPMMKGSPSSQFAMSGDYTTNDFLDYTSIDGTSRFIDVQARFEVYEDDVSVSKRLVVSAGDYKNTPTVSVINAAIQHTDKIGLNNSLVTCGSSTMSKQFLTRAPFVNFASRGITGYKSVRMDDEAEFLSWFQYTFANDGSGVYDMTDYYIRVTTEVGATVNLRYFQETLGNDGAISSAWWVGNTQFTDATVRKVLSQNVSPAFIESHTAGTITAADTWYEARLVCSGATLGSGKTVSEKRYYKIDREPVKLAYDFVRFHWLNRMGGIDSYTAKRDISETITSEKIFFERKSPNPLYTQQYNGTTYGTPRDPVGSDLYKPSVTTFSVEATRKKSVYTEPLNIPEAKWLEEIITSPNVWIELDTEAGEWVEARNTSMHPSTRDYFPVTINNSEFVTVNQQEGLVKLNIEYTMSHAINTQSN
tara:strand:+ start:3672 stop:5360 length:1689 start_codon:yes stop_codon:yes gene_type:complete